MRKLVLLLCIFLFFSCSTTQAVDAPEKTENSEEPANTDIAEKEEIFTDEKRLTGKEKLKPLSLDEIHQIIFDSAIPGFHPVIKEGDYLGIAYDLYGNGFHDFFVLFVQAETGEEAEFTRLSDISELYEPEIHARSYYMQAFLQDAGRLVKGKRLDLGKRIALSSIDSINLSGTKRRPFAIEIDFLTQEKMEREWVVYSDTGVSRFSFYETASVSAEIEDIDSNMIMDVVIRENVLQEGTGFETYLTWYKWNGTTFLRNGDTNILQNLNEFFQRGKKLLKAGRLADFIRYAAADPEVQKLRISGVTDEEIMTRLFTLVLDASGSERFSFDLSGISEIILPQIFEDPFYENEGLSVFPLEMRVICGREDYIFGGVMKMNENPFDKPQFMFILLP